VISVLLAGCLSVFVWGLSQTRPTAQPITYSDRAVTSLEPQPGVLALRQERIGVTLAPGYTLADTTATGLSINGIGIPTDQIDVGSGFFYTPGPGKEVSSIPPGRNCVTILIKVATDAGDQGHPFSWCFNSH
jgi:hypothetical protein